MATRRRKSINDLVEQVGRLRERAGRDPRNRARIERAYSNEVQRKLNKTKNGRLMIDVSRATDGGADFTNSFSPSNTAQRLYNMSRLGNKNAERLLYTKYDTVDRSNNSLRETSTRYVTASKSQGTT